MHFSIKYQSSFILFIFAYLTPFPVLAIPSPDLLISAGASIGQLLGLLAVTFGGLGFSLRKKLKASNQKASSWPFHISFICFIATLAAFAVYSGEQVDLNNKRLQANLIRPSIEAGKKVGDVSLKTLSFSQQLNDPYGISTEQVTSWINQGEKINLIDIREPEEIEFGTLPGAWHRRYPDIKINQQGVIIKKAKTILVCFSGNRSGETANELIAKGYNVYFMVGGVQKWISESRKMENSLKLDGVLRSLSPYSNDNVLLDTPEVETLLQKENALPIDVRYEKDFELNHLPGALNLPIRKMLSDVMEERIKQLPKDQPIIAPCYDKRSCFYAKILGLRLHRAGLDYHGRYTVPHEYMSPKLKKRAFVQDWQKQQDDSTLFRVIGEPIKAMLYWFNTQTGSIIIAILLAVLLLRIVFFPFTVKNEIDNIKIRQRKPQIKELKVKLQNDPQRLNRALRNISKTDKNTPLLNLIGTVGQIIFFVVLFTVVQEVGHKFNDVTLLNMSIASKDPTYIMPLLVSVLIYLLMYLSNTKALIKKKLFYLACSAIIFFLTFQISVVLNLYLSASIMIMIVHNYLVHYFYDRLQNSALGKNKKIRKKFTGVIPLKCLVAGQGGGGKSENLGELIRTGFSVPDGFAITSELLNKNIFSDNDKEKLREAWDALGAEKVAVRSSGISEDADDKSCAGLFESLLNVTWPEFYIAIDKVKESFSSVRAEAYIDQEETPGIVVQQMVDAEYAGVFFSEDPTTSGCCVIELVEGLGESLVSGEITPNSYRYGRYSLKPMFETPPPIDLMPLLEMGMKIESNYDNLPQDIEFAYTNGKFYLLQTRAITVNSRKHNHQKAFIERERRRLCELFKEQAADKTVLTKDALCELVPRPTRLTLSLINQLWQAGGTVSLACRILGFPYDVDENAPPYAVSAFGDIYVNQIEKNKRTSKSPGTFAAFQLSRAAEKIEQEFKEIFLPDFLDKVSFKKAVDFKRLPLNKLVDLCKEWLDEFITETYLQAEVINIAAEYFTQAASNQLEKRNENIAQELSHIPETVASYAMNLLHLIKEGKCDEHDFIELFGHRCRYDFELGMASYAEDTDTVATMVANAQPHYVAEKHQPKQFDNKVLQVEVTRARNFQALKEEAKHYTLIEYRLLRPLLIEIGERLNLPKDGIFNLSFDEVFRLNDTSFINNVFTLVEHRIKEASYFEQQETPLDFTLNNLETYGLNLELSISESADSKMLNGIRISGQGEVAGRARVITSPNEINVFQKGEILVARTTDPSWTPLFTLAAGVISDIGGMLSHAAIVARELNLPGIVNTRNATSIINTGDLVRLFEDGTVEIDKKTRRTAVRYPLNREIIMKSDERLINITIDNISLCGALIKMTPDDTDRLNFDTPASIYLDEEYQNIDFAITPRDKYYSQIQFVKSLTQDVLEKFRRRRSQRFEVNTIIRMSWGENELEAILLNISSHGALIKIGMDMISKIDTEHMGYFQPDKKYRAIDFKAMQRNDEYFELRFAREIGKDRLAHYAQ